MTKMNHVEHGYSGNIIMDSLKRYCNFHTSRRRAN